MVKMFENMGIIKFVIEWLFSSLKGNYSSVALQNWHSFLSELRLEKTTQAPWTCSIPASLWWNAYLPHLIFWKVVPAASVSQGVDDLSNRCQVTHSWNYWYCLSRCWMLCTNSSRLSLQCRHRISWGVWDISLVSLGSINVSVDTDHTVFPQQPSWP